MATATINTRSIQGESLDAVTDRLANLAMKEGVIDLAGNSYQVQQDTGANMQIKVGSGSAFDRAIVEGDLAGQGNYICEHQDATVTLTIAASDPTNDRIDIVVLRVYDDTFDSSGLDESDVEVIQGTPSGSPSPPAVPNGALKLAEVNVGNGVTAITNSDIDDFRYEAPTRGQLVETLYFTSSGSFVKANYPYLTKVRVKVQGPGGAGGGAATTGGGQGAHGGGGAGGGYAEKTVDASDLSASETVTVGTGGAGSAGAAGGNGSGPSSFGSHCSGGAGGGGNVGAASSTFAQTNGGVGGQGSGGDINANGGSGGRGGAWDGTTGMPGYGGGSRMSYTNDMPNIGASVPGTNGLLGSGGSGARNGASQGTARAGGDGGNGIVIVELYA